MNVTESDALIVVDVQNDFCPFGALPVPDGDKVVTIINQITPKFGCVFFSRDWHPENHCSFGDPPGFTDGSWPPHCIANSPGAEFHGDLYVPIEAPIIDKGTDSTSEAYSGFEGTKLNELLSERNITRIFVCGLATDYCVKRTVFDAVKLGFNVVLIENASKGITEASTASALKEMKKAGVDIRWSGDF